MEIKPNTNIDFVARVPHTAPKASRSVDSEAAVSEFESSRSLDGKLNDVPDIRSDRVENAKRMVGDPAYPPRETIHRIAALLALDVTETSVE
jgi:hypothetical protein